MIPRLAERVGERPQHRLDQGERQRERRGQQRHGLGRDAKIDGDRRNDGIHRAAEQGGRERDGAHPGEDATGIAASQFEGGIDGWHSVRSR
jgi:hypothetical protein